MEMILIVLLVVPMHLVGLYNLNLGCLRKNEFAVFMDSISIYLLSG